jgi:phospholipase C
MVLGRVLVRFWTIPAGGKASEFRTQNEENAMNREGLRKVSFGTVLLVLLALCACAGTGSPTPPGMPSIVFSANTNTIAAGQTVVLTWQASGTTSVTITASTVSASRTVVTSSQASGSVNDSPTQTTTYAAVATGPGGSTPPQNTIVQVAQPVQPQITQFTASPAAVNGGRTTTISWATTNATSVTIAPPVPQGDDTGALPTSGSSVVPVNTTTTFTITASGPGGTATKNLIVQVPLTLSFSASPTTISSAQQVTLTWQVSGGTATALSIDNGVCGSCALPQGTATVTPNGTVTYTASAKATDGSVITQAATVTVSTANSGVIKHIFFMLQENRSFDMYFGQLGAYRATRLTQVGITDTQTVNGFDPNVTLTNSHTGANVKPFHEATTCTETLSPSWDESHHDVSLNGGDPAWNTTTTFTDSSFLMRGFLDTTGAVTQSFDPNGTRAMGYYNQQELPYYYDLATFFATSDSWHSPLMASTEPNRMYLMAASSFGHEYKDDPNHPKYAAKTIFRAMNQANVSWLYYYKDGIFLGAHFADFSDPAIQLKTFPVSDLMARLQGSCSGNPCDPDKALPQVVFIESASGASGLDEHPDNNIQSGATYVQSIIAALMQSGAWHDSVFILSYDEAGGLYDHVPPFMVPPPDSFAPGQCPDPNNGSSGYCIVGTLGGQFNLTGIRVPVIVISPFAKPHFVSHTPRDYTAILAFVEKTFNVPALTARDAFWQDPSRDMSEFFDFSTPALLQAPNGQAWTQFLPSQPVNPALCVPTKEAGPTF